MYGYIHDCSFLFSLSKTKKKKDVNLSYEYDVISHNNLAQPLSTATTYTVSFVVTVFLQLKHACHLGLKPEGR